MSILERLFRKRNDTASVAKERLQNLEVAATVLERALGTEHFTALQRELGVQQGYRMTEAQADAVVRLQLGQPGQPAAHRATEIVLGQPIRRHDVREPRVADRRQLVVVADKMLEDGAVLLFGIERIDDG